MLAIKFVFNLEKGTRTLVLNQISFFKSFNDIFSYHRVALPMIWLICPFEQLCHSAGFWCHFGWQKVPLSYKSVIFQKFVTRDALHRSHWCQ